MCGILSENSGEIVHHPAPAPASIFNQFTKYKMGPFLAKIKQTKPGSL